jgi:hypothetical protein
MGLFETKNVTLALDKLVIIEHSDRFFSSVEPYVIPVFYKVDGEGYEAVLRIFNTIQPREGTTEVEQPGFIQFNVNSLQNGPGPEQDNPFTYIPPGDLLGRGSFDSGDEVDLSDVSFTTNLQPIPFRIDVLGLSNQDQILDALRGLLVDDPSFGTLLNTAFISINSFLSALLGLNETFESCPPFSENIDEFLNNIEAQFNCLIPGTVGGMFVFMENDEFSESVAKELQNNVRDEVERVLNDTINAIALNNPIPDPEIWADEEEIADNITSNMTWPVLSRILLSVGILVLGAISFNVFLVAWGLFTSLGWLFGGPDDQIGQVELAFDHTSLQDNDFVPGVVSGDDNEWEVHASIRVNN